MQWCRPSLRQAWQFQEAMVFHTRLTQAASGRVWKEWSWALKYDTLGSCRTNKLVSSTSALGGGWSLDPSNTQRFYRWMVLILRRALHFLILCLHMRPWACCPIRGYLLRGRQELWNGKNGFTMSFAQRAMSGKRLDYCLIRRLLVQLRN